MKRFHQHPDGHVIIIDGDKAYLDTAENFQADYGQAVPAIELGGIDRIYEPGVRHPISDGSSVVGGGDMPWAFGDAALAAIDTLINKQTARNTPPPQPAQPTPPPVQKVG